MKYEPAEFRIGGAILAGGKARRMGGIPKGMLRAGGCRSLIERLIEQMTRCRLQEIIISTNDERSYAHLRYTIVPDKRVDMGPLAGIEAALEHFAGRCDAVLCLPCDVPALSSKEISTLVSAFVATGDPVVLAETEGPVRHPLCAVVRSSLLDEVSAALDRGTLAAGDLWLRLGGTMVHFENPDGFINLNRLDDLDAWLAGTGRHNGND